MGWNYGPTTPGAIGRALLDQIAAHLGDQDRIGIVTYGTSADIALPIVGAGDSRIAPAIAGLHEDGSTNMEAGLSLAYSIAEAERANHNNVRIVLFTDEQPNVGATSPAAFGGMVKAGADKGVGITVFGLGQGLGIDVMTAMSHLRGGNAFALSSPDEVPQFMSDNWPWMFSPIANDLKLSVEPPSSLRLVHAFGFPSDTATDTGVSLDVSTVFLSKNRGALLLQLAPQQDLAPTQLSVSLGYQDLDGQAHSETLTPAYGGQSLDARGVYMPQAGTAKAVALALLVDGMHEAAALYETDRQGAIDLLTKVLDRFSADSTAIGDPALATEAAFWPKLLDLMKGGAAQGDLYGGF